MELIKRIFGLLIVVLILPGCTMLGTYMDPQQPTPEYYINNHVVRPHFVRLTPSWFVNHQEIPTYYVGPYDILNVIVWDHPELTTPTSQLSSPADSGLLVSGRGYISFPFAGTFKVSGLRISEIESLIETRISKYIRNPQVTVRVAKFRSQEVQILGEVGGQKTIPLTDRPMSLLDGLNSVGGTNVATANTTHIYVIRGDLQHLTVYVLNAKSPATMMLAQRFMLKNNDIVYVSPLAVTNWNRIISQILPSVSAVQTTQTTENMVK